MMEFFISKKAKDQARRRRIKTEKIWTPYRCAYKVLFTISPIAFALSLIAGFEHELVLVICGFIFATTLICGILIYTIVLSAAQHWIHDRYNERLWMDDHCLYHLSQTPWGAGLNARSVDDTAYMMAIELNTIKLVRYDENSKRVEIFGQGKGIHFDSLSRWHVDKEWELKEGFYRETYDYFEPSLVETLEKKGITISREEINNFKMFDNTI